MAMDNFVMDKDTNHGGLWPMTLIMTYVIKKHKSFTMQCNMQRTLNWWGRELKDL
jgi:hypothetical protein